MTWTVEELKALLDDESFVTSISKMEDNTEVQKAFEERGISFTLEEIDQIVEKLYGDNPELNEEALEEVSGGFVITGTVLAAVGCVTAGVSLFAGVMAEVNKNRKGCGKKPIW